MDDNQEDIKIPDIKASNKLAKLKKNKGIMKNKLVFMSKILKMQRILREENEKIIKIKSLNNNKLPHGILLEGKDALNAFTSAKSKDRMNEKRPF